MAPHLPDDILYIICAQLFNARDFNTLYNCSISSRSLTVPALQNLYRMQDVAPVKSSGADEAKDSVARWANLWHSLLSSSLDKTVYPYCRYIRVLDLNDLGQLFQDGKFRTKYSKTFFSGELAPFLILQNQNGNVSTRGRPVRFDTSKMLEAIGESIVSKAPMLEELITGDNSGELSKTTLASWIPQLKHLRHLRLFDGLVAADSGPLLRQFCPEFRGLKFYNALFDADAPLAQLLEDLTPNTFESLEVFGSVQIGEALFSSFNRHAETLTELKLGDIEKPCLPALPKMKSCTALRTLHFKVKDGPDIDNLEAQLPEIIEWLQSCRFLQDLSFENFSASSQILTPLLQNPSTVLESLSVLNYKAIRASEFHASLPYQRHSLRSLNLKADGEQVNMDILSKAVNQLTSLTDLRLQGVGDYFNNMHLISLAKSLPYLEDLWISGWRIDDAIWNAFSGLGKLTRLEINAFSAFTVSGILGFIDNLGRGNHGITISIMLADPSNGPLSDEDIVFIKEHIANRIEGRFEYQLARDPDAVEYDSSLDSD